MQIENLEYSHSYKSMKLEELIADDTWQMVMRQRTVTSCE